MISLSRRKFIKGSFLGAIGFILLDAFGFEKFLINWNEIEVSDNKSNSIKILQLSDLHLTEVNYWYENIAKNVNKIKPDLVFITGDAINEQKNLGALDKFMGIMNKEIRKFAITGNWEHWGEVDMDELREVYARHGCELLMNESAQISMKNRSLSIIGVEDYVGGNVDFQKAISNHKESDMNIVLTHCPAHRDKIEKERGDLKIDLVLSGHTHGGQINLFGYVPFTPHGSGKYISGWYADTGPKLYVSKGIGTSILPIRFGSRAEVPIFNV